MSRTKKPELSTPQIRAILLRHEGSMAKIADSLGVRAAAVSQTMLDKMTSRRIHAACLKMAEAKLREESRAGSAA